MFFEQKDFSQDEMHLEYIKSLKVNNDIDISIWELDKKSHLLEGESIAVNCLGPSPMAFTLRKFQTAMLFGRALLSFDYLQLQINSQGFLVQEY